MHLIQEDFTSAIDLDTGLIEGSIAPTENLIKKLVSLLFHTELPTSHALKGVHRDNSSSGRLVQFPII